MHADYSWASYARGGQGSRPNCGGRAGDVRNALNDAENTTGALGAAVTTGVLVAAASDIPVVARDSD